MNLDRIEASEVTELGVATCRVCGMRWLTTPEQDALLADLIEHDATHDGVDGGGGHARAGGGGGGDRETGGRSRRPPPIFKF